MKGAFLKKTTLLLFLLIFSANGIAIADFSDVFGHKYESAINFVEGRGIIDGYPDGFFRPDRLLNRAELLKFAMNKNFPESEISAADGEKCFPDTPQGEWYTKYVCAAKSAGIVSGEPDGLFHPADKINFVEALKILSLSYGLPFDESGDTWFEEGVNNAYSLNIVPEEIENFDQKITRGQTAEMLFRIISHFEDYATAPESDYLPYLPPETVYSQPVSVPLPSGDILPAPAPILLPVPPLPQAYAPQAQSQAPSQPASQPIVSQDPKTFPLIQFEDLVYEGAFRVPGDGFAYGGTALTYNPVKDSLYMVGHDWYQKVAEISIPQLVKSEKLSDLNKAVLLQDFYDVADGKRKEVDNGATAKIGGLLVYMNKLIASIFSYYDADRSQKLSHVVSSLDLSIPDDAQGVYELGNLGAGFVSGYMAHVPAEWQAEIGAPALVGQCCIAIIGRTSFGPSAFGFDPENLGKISPVPVTPLVYYTADHVYGGGYNHQSEKFNGTAGVGGLVFPSGRRSVLYIGRIGVGPFCYGTGDECGDPDLPDHGTHAYPYKYQIWAYDVLDFLKVKNGEKKPWEIEPYGIWNFTLPWQKAGRSIVGVTYDSKRNLIYMAQAWGDKPSPVIHAFSIRGR